MVSGLKKGDTIGVFSPSRPITAEAPEAVKKAVRFLEKNGYYVKMGRLTGRSDWYRSGSVEERADELNELIHDQPVGAFQKPPQQDSSASDENSIGGFRVNAPLPDTAEQVSHKIPGHFLHCMYHHFRIIFRLAFQDTVDIGILQKHIMVPVDTGNDVVIHGDDTLFHGITVVQTWATAPHQQKV